METRKNERRKGQKEGKRKIQKLKTEKEVETENYEKSTEKGKVKIKSMDEERDITKKEK